LHTEVILYYVKFTFALKVVNIVDPMYLTIFSANNFGKIKLLQQCLSPITY